MSMDLPKPTCFVKLVDGNTIPVSEQVYDNVIQQLDVKDNEWVEFNSYGIKERFRVRVEYVVLLFSVSKFQM
jgi:hypothetical protein